MSDLWQPPDCKLCKASARCAKVQVEPRQEAICQIQNMTFGEFFSTTKKSQSVAWKRHSCWNRTIEGYVKENSHCWSAFGDGFFRHVLKFSVPGSCLMQVHYLNDVGIAGLTSR